jgi:probable HAF family extracellular repeat protein
VSYDKTGTVCRAFLWQDGVMTDLNTLVPTDTALFLIYGGDINSSGEIVGQAFDQSTGDTPAFLAIPCDAKHAGVEGCEEHRGTQAPPRAKPVNVRRSLCLKTFVSCFASAGALANPILAMSDGCPEFRASGAF